MAKSIVNDIRKNTRRQFGVEEKIRIIIEGLRGEIAITELCRREKIAASQYYKWSKQFLEAGKTALTRETSRNATDDEVRELRDENDRLKIALAESHIDVIKYKKSIGLR
jgi:transposase